MITAIFNTHGQDTTWNSRSGEMVTVLRPLTEDEADLDLTGKMYKVRFEDGTVTDAFENELTAVC